MTSVPRSTPSFQTILDHLHRGATHAYYWHVTPEGQKRTLWYPTQRRPQPSAAWLQSGSLYYGVHGVAQVPSSTSSKTGKQIPAQYLRARAQDVAAVNALYAEFDCKDYGSTEAIYSHLDTLDLYPTAIVASGGGLHCYWLIEDTQLVTDDNRAAYRALQAAWVALVGGDEGAKDLCRVLRLPGTLNRKYTPARPVELVEFEPRRIFVFARLAELVADQVHGATERRPIPTRTNGTGQTQNIARLLAWALSDPRRGSRHNVAVNLAFRLREAGASMTDAELVVEAYVNQAITDRPADGEAVKAVAYAYR